ncbi:zinc finger protein 677 isoform X1 [Anopheles bellator]|uniref:zinc finger protein 677 isoform X1 n=1 Tax=Anopheles bellator TaxID=139047 RepID=UPI002647D1E8|nr:zinc finger protein 677 isoform X1 [Anopheles bellator]
MIIKLCRLCLAKTRKLIKVSEVQSVSGDKLNLEDLIHRYLAIDRSYGGATIMLCTKCAKVLKDWHTFYQSCLENDAKYIKTLETKLDTTKTRNRRYGIETVLIKSEYVPQHRNDPSAKSSMGSSCRSLPVEDMLEETSCIDVAEKTENEETNEKNEERNGDEMLMETKFVQRCQSSNPSKVYSSLTDLSGNVDFDLVLKSESTIYEGSVTEQIDYDNEINSISVDMDDGRGECNTGPIKNKSNYTDGRRLCDNVKLDLESMGHEPEFVCLTDNISDDNVQNGEPIFGPAKSPTMRSESKSVTPEPSTGTGITENTASTVKPVRRAKISGVCHICGLFRKHLTMHMKIHNGERNHKCPYCPAAFVDSSSCKQHINAHTREKMYKCNLCDKEYSSLNVLRNHKDSHSEKKKHVCKTCGNAYRYRAALRRHIKTHTDEPKIKCTKCEMRFYYKGRMLSHLRSHFAPEFSCAICDKRYTKKSSLDTHIKIKHKYQTACPQGLPTDAPIR